MEEHILDSEFLQAGDDKRNAQENATEERKGLHANAKDAQTQNPDIATSEHHVQATNVAYEKKILALQQELRVRDITMMELADENESLNKGFMELKAALKEAVSTRAGLVDKLSQQQRIAQTALASLRKAEAEANDARREANDARREATESSVYLADAKADLWAIREAAKGKALGEDERRDLEGALKALSASSQRAAQEASYWKEKAESWKGRLVSLQAELESEGKALVIAETKLAVAYESLKEAELRCNEATCSQAVLDSANEQLRQETERRARTFNAALKTAVSKIQIDLESQRDVAMQKISALQSDVESKVFSLMEANVSLEISEPPSLTHVQKIQLRSR